MCDRDNNSHFSHSREILKLIYASSDVGLSATIWDECPVEGEKCKQIGFFADGGTVWDIPRRKQQAWSLIGLDGTKSL